MIVIHHIGGTNRDVTAEEIHGWHLSNGWSGIGYHYVIRKDGTVERGRPKEYTGSHAYGFNSQSIGVNVVGEFEGFEPEPVQIESLVKLLADLCEFYSLEPNSETIIGHRDLMSTECPGTNLYSMLPEIRDKVKIA